MQMHKERIYKCGYDNLEIVYDSWCKIILYILGVSYWKLLEMTFFIPPNTFLGVAKLHILGKKILGTLGYALICYTETIAYWKY
jgi:hypothetical protein